MRGFPFYFLPALLAAGAAAIGIFIFVFAGVLVDVDGAFVSFAIVCCQCFEVSYQRGLVAAQYSSVRSIVWKTHCGAPPV